MDFPHPICSAPGGKLSGECSLILTEGDSAKASEKPRQMFTGIFGSLPGDLRLMLTAQRDVS